MRCHDHNPQDAVDGALDDSMTSSLPVEPEAVIL
jgi:hypothetical protein